MPITVLTRRNIIFSALIIICVGFLVSSARELWWLHFGKNLPAFFQDPFILGMHQGLIAIELVVGAVVLAVLVSFWRRN